MNTILKTLIDYSLFEKYNKEYFLNNRIIPIYENDISIKFAVCKSSKLNTIKDDFQKLINFIEIEELELLFILNHIDKKILLYDLSSKSILQNSFEKFIDKFLNELLLFSIKLRASDIHIEQYKDLILFKFRIDGKLKTFFTFKKEFFKFISSFIKLNSNLDMTQCRLPLDGRFSLNIENKKYDFRVSTMPTLEAESIVLRILDNKNINKNLQTLGLSQNLLEILSKTLKLTQGLILISGPTGSGKTTITKLLLNVFSHYQGQILVNGEDIKQICKEDIDRIFAIVTQVPMAMNGTIRENVDITNTLTDEEIYHYLDLVELKDDIEKFPLGLNTFVGENGQNISGGQKQRIAIARAFLRNPDILMLDEATANLDGQSEEKIQQAIKSLMKGRTTLIIAHRLSTIVKADKIFFLENGEITGSGTHQELIKNHLLYAKYVEEQLI
mgnify:CR=1 FL=1